MSENAIQTQSVLGTNGTEEGSVAQSGLRVLGPLPPEDVARRALDIHLERGRPLCQWQSKWQGDWHQAERELQDAAAIGSD